MFTIVGLFIWSLSLHTTLAVADDAPAPIVLPVESYSTSYHATPYDVCLYNGKSSWQPDPTYATGSCTSPEDLQALISKNKSKWAKEGLQAFCKTKTRLPASVGSHPVYHQSRVRQARCSPDTKKVEYELLCNACKSSQK